MSKIKKVAVIAATLFFGSICAGYFIYGVVEENVMTQIEGKNLKQKTAAASFVVGSVKDKIICMKASLDMR